MIVSRGSTFFGSGFLNDKAGCNGFGLSSVGDTTHIFGDGINLLEAVLGRIRTGVLFLVGSDIEIVENSSRGFDTFPRPSRYASACRLDFSRASIKVLTISVVLRTVGLFIATASSWWRRRLSLSRELKRSHAASCFFFALW